MTAADTGAAGLVLSAPGWSRRVASASVGRVRRFTHAKKAARAGVGPLVAVWCALAAPAQGMVVVKRSFPELVARAEQIVVGTVTDVREGPDEGGTPCTWVTLSDLIVLKGEVGSAITLRLFGGTSGPNAAWISDMPAFSPGQRAVLFVAGNGRDVCPLVGVWQGRFRVRHDDTLDADVVEDQNGLPITGRIGPELTRGARAERRAALTLDEFLSLVHDEMAQPSVTPDAAP
jgi:hypothetical protein